MKKRLLVAKFGGSLIDKDGKGISKILNQITRLKRQSDVGPVAVFSAPLGCTDELIRLGEAVARSSPQSVKPIFKIYQHIAELYLRGDYLKQALVKMATFEKQTLRALHSVSKRFDGNLRAKVLTLGGELATSDLMSSIISNTGLKAETVPTHAWPVVTDDTFEDALPNFELSKKRINSLIALLEADKIVSLAGFLGVTSDGLETILGRGGSDLTAVFVSCLLKDAYHVETLLFKDVPIQSADPKIVRGQKTSLVAELSYNEAHKASLMGMKIVQPPAIAFAKRFSQQLQIVPINEINKRSIIQAEAKAGDIVKCLTGKDGCAILSMKDEKSRSLEDMLRVWERRNDFIDLGAETLETGERLRDFLFLDSEFLRKNDERLRGFDYNLRVEYGLGVVTLIGDKMKDSPGVASIAISAIKGINIKRAVFAPHTSQIILVVQGKNVNATVASIHLKRADMNRSEQNNS